MKNEDLIKALRECEYCNVCSIAVDGDCPFGGRDELEVAAADALEAAEQRIAELEADKKTLINVVKDKSDFRATKDAMRIAELEAQLPKEGEWIAEPMTREKFYNDPYLSAKCSICGANSRERGHYCPNCGARMKGEQE